MKKLLLLLFLLSNSALCDDWPHQNISQAVFAKSVENRMPVEILTSADNTLDKIYFFTNIRHLSGERITHRWIYTPQGTHQRIVKAQVSFDIKGQRWRVWSSKNLWHKWTGVWQVEVVDSKDNILLTKTFTYKAKNE